MGKVTLFSVTGRAMVIQQFDDLSAGDRQLSASWLNSLAEQIERQANLTVSPPLAMEDLPTGQHLYLLDVFNLKLVEPVVNIAPGAFGDANVFIWDSTVPGWVASGEVVSVQNPYSTMLPAGVRRVVYFDETANAWVPLSGAIIPRLNFVDPNNGNFRIFPNSELTSPAGAPYWTVKCDITTGVTVIDGAGLGGNDPTSYPLIEGIAASDLQQGMVSLSNQRVGLGVKEFGWHGSGGGGTDASDSGARFFINPSISSGYGKSVCEWYAGAPNLGVGGAHARVIMTTGWGIDYYDSSNFHFGNFQLCPSTGIFGNKGVFFDLEGIGDQPSWHRIDGLDGALGSDYGTPAAIGPGATVYGGLIINPGSGSFGGMTIGNPVSGATAHDVLYVDPAGNLGQISLGNNQLLMGQTAADPVPVTATNLKTGNTIVLRDANGDAQFRKIRVDNNSVDFYNGTFTSTLTWPTMTAARTASLQDASGTIAYLSDIPTPTGGTVTSVGLSLPSIITVSGSPVTTSGTLTGTLATQAANLVFAGPTAGGAATPTFRALTAADLPAGTGGTVTSVGLSLPAIFSVTGSPVTTSGTLTGTLATQSANLIFAGPSTGAAAAPTFRALATADLPVGTGTVTSVALTMPAGFTVTGSPVTTAGTLAVTITGDVSLSSHKLTNVTDPTSAQDAATKAYVDSVAQGLDAKASVRITSTANLGLSGLAAIDGVTPVAGDRVLAKDQTTASQNGIYVAVSGAWSRATDANTAALLTTGAFVFTEEGTVNAKTGWVLTTPEPITLGTTALTWTQFSGAGTYTATNGLQLVGTQFSPVYGTAANTVTQGNDSRLSDARTPTAHHATHEPGGSDPMAVDAAAATGSLRTLGTGATQAAAGNDTRIVNAVQTTRTITPGTDLRGGGDLSANRTIDLDVESFAAGRLTLTSNTPVTVSDVTAATTIYYSPYQGNSISLYNGVNFQARRFTETSVAVPSTLFRLFDIYGYDNSGTFGLETLDWDQTTGTITGATAASPCVITSNSHGLSNGDLVGIAGIVGTVGTDATRGVNGKIYEVAGVTTNTFQLAGSNTTTTAYTSGGTWYKIPNTRTTALILLNGEWYKTGDLTRRYLGTGMTTGTSGQTEDSAAKRLLWNNHNRRNRFLKVIETTDSWTYTVSAWRAANGSTANRVQIVRGLDEDSMEATVHGTAGNGSLVNYAVGVGLKTTSANSAQTFGSVSSGTTQGYAPLTAEYRGCPGLGYSFLQWLENSAAVGTTTWLGDNGTTVNQCGLVASGLF